MTRVVLVFVLLVATYLLTLGSSDPWDVAAGAAVAAGTLAAFGAFLREGRSGGGGARGRRLARAGAFVPFALVVVRDIVVGTWSVALVVLHLRPLAGPGIVAVPYGERTGSGVVVSAFVATLSPGEFLVDIDEQRRVMLLHVLDARDPEAVRRRLDAFYERWQRPVFP